MKTNLDTYQEEKRASTLRDIDIAIQELRARGDTVSKKSIAQELGLHTNTMQQKYIKLHLRNYKEFGCSDNGIPIVESVEELKFKLQEQKALCAKQKVTIKRLKEKNEKLSKTLDTLEREHEHLLMYCNNFTKKKTISLD